MRYEAIKNNRIIRYTYYYLRGMQKKKWRPIAQKTIDRFELSFETPKERDAVVENMLLCFRRYGFAFDEYLYLKLYEKSPEEIREFVADWEHLGYTCTLNDHNNDDTFDNKWKTYQAFKKYYKRVILFCNNETNYDDFASFVADHPSFIVKPLDASCGRGIQIIHSDADQTIRDLWVNLWDEYHGCFIVEELIRQADEMAKFHPASVNTVRVPTIRMDDEVLIVHPFMRMGQHEKPVDNGGAGGIICAADAESGIILAAADEHGHCYHTHPYSNETIIGFHIPHWEEAKAMVKEMALVLPSNRYTGWDLALTDDGWKLVEANRRGQFIWQIPLQSGFRSEINQILKKLGKKY